MSTPVATAERPASGGPSPKSSRFARQRVRSQTSVLARGEPMLWLTGGALAVALLMVVGLLSLVFVKGFLTFWPSPVVLVKLTDGTIFMGEASDVDRFKLDPDVAAKLSPAVSAKAQQLTGVDGKTTRRMIRTGNYDLTNTHFNWVSDFDVVDETQPADAVVIERLSWGRFYGTPKAFLLDGKEVATKPEDVWSQFSLYHDEVRERWAERKRLETEEIGEVNAELEHARLLVKATELDYQDSPPAVRDRAVKSAEAALAALQVQADVEYQRIRKEIDALNAENKKYQIVLTTAQGQDLTLELAEVVRMYQPNALDFSGKMDVFLSRWGEFLFDEPREANSEGGVFPAIWGTVAMTLIMTCLVVPFGVLAALYLREYAKDGLVVSIIRIAINNLAGVPSIVFGVFGLGFFCYLVGAFVDGGPKNAGVPVLPSWGWFVLLGVTSATAVAAFILTLLGPRSRLDDATWRHVARGVGVVLWVAATSFAVALIAFTPFFDGFYAAKVAAGTPTLGKGGILWASLTLALLTLPVVIVAAEEALAAVPRSMREGSYACGASKWQTIKNIVLPRAAPGIMTGAILAMARGAGEVAPIMLVGAVKLAPDLPIDGVFPYVHPSRSFMHLGFHIYDLGFQSQNSEAAKPMVFTTTLLLIAVIAVMNLAAIWMRLRLRRKFIGNQF